MTWQPRTIRWWYESLADAQLAHPEWVNRDLAAHLGCSVQQISNITRSDVWAEYWARRRAQFNFSHDQKLIQKSLAIADKSAELILEVMDKKRDAIPLTQLNEIHEGAMQRLGFGVKPDQLPGLTVNAPGGQVVITSASKAQVEDARKLVREVQEQRRLPAPQAGERTDGEVRSAPSVAAA